MDRARVFMRVVLIGYLVAVHAVVGYLLIERAGWLRNFPAGGQEHSKPTASATLTTTPTATATIQIVAPSPPGEVPGTGLIVPVFGVKPTELLDTFGQQRDEDRVHGALDIPAAQGTPVIATADGTIARHHDSVRGGFTIYQLSDDGQWVFYYAHLQRRADAAVFGAKVARGDVIGYVGDTGNAGAGNYHLHFAIWRVSDPKRIWEGENIDPYPILRFGQPLPR